MPDELDKGAGGGLGQALGSSTVAAEELSAEALGLEQASLSQRQLVIRRFRQHKLAMVALIVLVLIGLAVLLAPLLTNFGYEEQHLQHKNERPGTMLTKDGREVGRAWLGTDSLGRDQLTRLLYGGRISLASGVAVATFATIIGALIGAIAGFFGGWLDNFLMRITDLLLAIPLLVILIIASQILGPGIFNTVLILSLFFWMPLARIVRGVFLSLKEKEFVEAARALGAGNGRIMLRHMLPNALGPIVVSATLAVALAILTESLLSFLGFGIQPPTPTWGNMLFQSKGYTQIYPWLVWFPGLAILVTVLCVNFLGDGLRDALDPTQQRARA